jgi:hypothetical protein
MAQLKGKGTKSDPLTWRDFVSAFAHAFEQGTSPADFESAYVGRKIRWEGEVYEVFGKEAYLPGIQVTMPRETVPLSDGRTFVGEFLSLRLKSPGALLAAKKLKRGERFTFEGEFADPGVLGHVHVAESVDEPEVLVRLGLTNGEPLDRPGKG